MDADAGTAWVAAGRRWDQVIREAAPAGLAPLSGSAPHVGTDGYVAADDVGDAAWASPCRVRTESGAPLPG